MNHKMNLAIVVTQKMIDEMEQSVAQAVRREDWRRAADLKSYVDGMKQIQVILEQTAKNMEAE